MDFLKSLVKNRIKKHFVALENKGKRSKFLNYWCYEGNFSSDAFKLNIYVISYNPDCKICYSYIIEERDVAPW